MPRVSIALAIALLTSCGAANRVDRIDRGTVDVVPIAAAGLQTIIDLTTTRLDGNIEAGHPPPATNVADSEPVDPCASCSWTPRDHCRACAGSDGEACTDTSELPAAMHHYVMDVLHGGFPLPDCMTL